MRYHREVRERCKICGRIFVVPDEYLVWHLSERDEPECEKRWRKSLTEEEKSFYNNIDFPHVHILNPICPECWREKVR